MKKHLKHGLPLWFTLIFSAFALAQQKPPSSAPSGDHTLRVAVDVVMLDVSVTDENGRFVKDLGKDSFKIYEDKVQQPLTFFSSEEGTGYRSERQYVGHEGYIRRRGPHDQ